MGEPLSLRSLRRMVRRGQRARDNCTRVVHIVDLPCDDSGNQHDYVFETMCGLFVARGTYWLITGDATATCIACVIDDIQWYGNRW